MKAKSIKGKSTEEITSALAESMGDGFKSTLAINFMFIKQDRTACNVQFSFSDLNKTILQIIKINHYEKTIYLCITR